MVDLIHPDDANLIVEVPEPGFSPAHNRAVMQNVIKKNAEYAKLKAKKWEAGLEYRADAAASYLNHLAQGNSTPMDKYFGRELQLKIWGERLTERMRQAAVRREQGGDGLVIL